LPNFGEISQTLPCIKLSIVLPKYRLLKSFSISNSHHLHAILFFIIFFILAPFFTFFPQDLSVTFLPQDICQFPPHQAINERKQAIDFLGTGPTLPGYKVGFGSTRTRSSSKPSPTTQSTRTDVDNAIGDIVDNDKNPNLKNLNFTVEIGKKQPNLTMNFPSQM
jgi:hypothetical protein